MTAPIIQFFAPRTGELAGSFPAAPHPGGEGWLIPALATEKPPPKTKKGVAAVFSAGAWSLQPDRRGETWYTAGGTPVVVEALGDPAAFDPPLSAKAPPPPPIDLADYISTGHKTLRDGGVQIGGMRIATDAESRGLIDGAYALSQARPDAKIDFKAASGWITVDAQTMQTIAVAVGQWVQLCYSAYRRLDEARAGGTVTTTDQVDAAYAAVALPG